MGTPAKKPAVIQVDKSSDLPSWRIRLAPNRSMNAEVALKVFSVMSVICLTIAGFFAMQGLWMPLPFAGAELAGLGYCWYLVLKHGELEQVIELDPAEVQVTGEPADFHARFNSHWVRIERGVEKFKGHPKPLLLTSHGRQVEVGRFLTESERMQLQGQLTATLGALRT